MASWLTPKAASKGSVKGGSSTSSNSNDKLSPAVVVTIEAVKWGIAMGLSYYLSRKLVEMMKEISSQGGKGDIVSARRVLAKRLNRPDVETMPMNAYEARIAADVLAPDEIDTNFENIGGLEDELTDVKDNVVLPMQMWGLFKGSSEIPPCPTGVLLYGRPGTGKSMTAKAIAKECAATFISIKASTVMDKWFGESDKLVSALFSLGRKLAPSIIFIDEIETLLKKRDGSDGSLGSAFHSMQGTFLSEWDGLSSSSAAPVVVLGATNRPMDLDKAFLRRMPVSIKMVPPDFAGRVDILRKMLAGERVDPGLDLDAVARRAVDFTGSDLRELVRVACLQRAKDVVRNARKAMGGASNSSGGGGGGGRGDVEVGGACAASTSQSTENLIAAVAEKKASESTAGLVGVSKAAAFVHMRALTTADFDFALGKTRKSGSAADDYASELILETTDEAAGIIKKVMASLGGQKKATGAAETEAEAEAEAEAEGEVVDTDDMD